MASDLVRLIKQASMDAVNASTPMDMRYGTVITTVPIQIKITNNFVLPQGMLVIPQYMTKHLVNLTDVETGETKAYIYDNSLKMNDIVVLIREPGGRKFVVVDRMPVE